MSVEKTTETTSTTRSPERTQLLTDILTTAIEGGVQYWAAVREYVHNGDDPHAILIDHDEDGGCEEVGCCLNRVDLDVIATGVNRIVNSHQDQIPGLPNWQRKVVRAAARQNDACPEITMKDEDRPGFGNFGSDIDADVADNILQVGLFGEVVYG